MHYEQLCDFAEETLFSNVDDPANLPFGRDELFQHISDDCKMTLEDADQKEELWKLVLKSREDVGCAITALEDIASQYENENTLTSSSLSLPEIGMRLIDSFEKNMATWLTSEQIKWKKAYAKHFADKFLGVSVEQLSSEEEDEEPPSESDEDEENEGEGEDVDYESEGAPASDSDEERDFKRQKHTESE